MNYVDNGGLILLVFNPNLDLWSTLCEGCYASEYDLMSDKPVINHCIIKTRCNKASGQCYICRAESRLQ